MNISAYHERQIVGWLSYNPYFESRDYNNQDNKVCYIYPRYLINNNRYEPIESKVDFPTVGRIEVRLQGQYNAAEVYNRFGSLVTFRLNTVPTPNYEAKNYYSLRYNALLGRERSDIWIERLDGNAIYEIVDINVPFENILVDCRIMSPYGQHALYSNNIMLRYGNSFYGPFEYTEKAGYLYLRGLERFDYIAGCYHVTDIESPILTFTDQNDNPQIFCFPVNAIGDPTQSRDRYDIIDETHLLDLFLETLKNRMNYSRGEFREVKDYCQSILEDKEKLALPEERQIRLKKLLATLFLKEDAYQRLIEVTFDNEFFRNHLIQDITSSHGEKLLQNVPDEFVAEVKDSIKDKLSADLLSGDISLNQLSSDTSSKGNTVNNSADTASAVESALQIVADAKSSLNLLNSSDFKEKLRNIVTEGEGMVPHLQDIFANLAFSADPDADREAIDNEKEMHPAFIQHELDVAKMLQKLALLSNNMLVSALNFNEQQGNENSEENVSLKNSLEQVSQELEKRINAIEENKLFEPYRETYQGPSAVTNELTEFSVLAKERQERQEEAKALAEQQAKELAEQQAKELAEAASSSDKALSATESSDSAYEVDADYDDSEEASFSDLESEYTPRNKFEEESRQRAVSIKRYSAGSDTGSVSDFVPGTLGAALGGSFKDTLMQAVKSPTPQNKAPVAKKTGSTTAVASTASPVSDSNSTVASSELIKAQQATKQAQTETQQVRQELLALQQEFNEFKSRASLPSDFAKLEQDFKAKQQSYDKLCAQFQEQEGKVSSLQKALQQSLAKYRQDASAAIVGKIDGDIINSILGGSVMGVAPSVDLSGASFTVSPALATLATNAAPISSTEVSAAEAMSNSAPSFDMSCLASAKDLGDLNKILDHIGDYVNTVGNRNLSNNDIANYLICITQGFITTFAGEPGTGKTSLCNLLARALGLSRHDQNTRFTEVSVERGWTSLKDLIGYYNPLTKRMEKSNAAVFDAFVNLNREAQLAPDGGAYDPSKIAPYLILLDEANLSPIEHYWAAFFRNCDFNNLTQRSISLGGNANWILPDHLRFLATVNFDHTTEELSPRFLDRSWVITLEPSTIQTEVEEVGESEPAMIPFSSLLQAFGPSHNDKIDDAIQNKWNAIQAIFADERCALPIRPRNLSMVQNYCAVANRCMSRSTPDTKYAPLDYAVAQKILPTINGTGDRYHFLVEELLKECTEQSMPLSARHLKRIARNGGADLGFYQFFSR